MKDVKFHAERQLWNDGIAIHIAQKSDGELSIAQPIEMKVVERGEFHQPAMVLDIRSAQQLMDELWHCGLRPTEGTGSAGSLAATERHLEDMRRLVFEDKCITVEKGGAACN